MAANTTISIENLLLGYSTNTPILPHLNARAAEGELIALIGRNGTGKSTLLRAMAGLLAPLHGSVSIKGIPIQKLHRVERAQLLSFVPSEPVRIPNLSVFEFVLMSRYPHSQWGTPISSSDREHAHHAIRAVGIRHLAHREIIAISDGERQRAMIAFALAQDTPIILMDEPTAFLDLPNKFETVRLLSELAYQRGRTIVYSTHDLQGAMSEAHTLWMILPTGLTTGLPEELAMDGNLELLMQGTRITLDQNTGSFRNAPRGKHKVSLTGTQALIPWTQRMMQRLGFNVVESKNSSLNVNCLSTSSQNQWEVTRNGNSIGNYKTLKELAHSLQHIANAKDSSNIERAE